MANGIYLQIGATTGGDAQELDEETRQGVISALLEAGYNNVVSVRLVNVDGMRAAIDGMHAFAKGLQNEHGEIEDYHTYDYGMTDWREDIAFEAGQFVASLDRQAAE